MRVLIEKHNSNRSTYFPARILELYQAIKAGLTHTDFTHTVRLVIRIAFENQIQRCPFLELAYDHGFSGQELVGTVPIDNARARFASFLCRCLCPQRVVAPVSSSACGQTYLEVHRGGRCSQLTITRSAIVTIVVVIGQLAIRVDALSFALRFLFIDPLDTRGAKHPV